MLKKPYQRHTDPSSKFYGDTESRLAYPKHHIDKPVERPIPKWQRGNVKFTYKSTSQADFRRFDAAVVPRFKPRPNLYVERDAPMDTLTTNNADFVYDAKAAAEDMEDKARIAAGGREDHVHMGDGKFRAETESRSAYAVDFTRASRATRKGKLPYQPNRMPLAATTTANASFMPHNAPPPTPVEPRKSQLKMDAHGASEFHSTNRDDFVYDFEAVKMANVNTAMRPHSQERAGPAPKDDFTTTSRVAFQSNPIDIPAKIERPKYVPSPVKFMAKSVAQADFQKWDSEPPERYKPVDNKAMPTTDTPFETKTCAMESFAVPEAVEQPARRRAADNIRPSGKPLMAETTSRAAFVPHDSRPRPRFKPDTTAKVNIAYYETRDFMSDK